MKKLFLNFFHSNKVEGTEEKVFIPNKRIKLLPINEKRDISVK